MSADEKWNVRDDLISYDQVNDQGNKAYDDQPGDPAKRIFIRFLNVLTGLPETVADGLTVINGNLNVTQKIIRRLLILIVHDQYGVMIQMINRSVLWTDRRVGDVNAIKQDPAGNVVFRQKLFL